MVDTSLPKNHHPSTRSRHSLPFLNTITCLVSLCVILVSTSLESSVGLVMIGRSAPAFNLKWLSSIQNQEVPSLSSVVTAGNPKHTRDNAPVLVMFLPFYFTEFSSGIQLEQISGVLYEQLTPANVPEPWKKQCHSLQKKLLKLKIITQYWNTILILILSWRKDLPLLRKTHSFLFGIHHRLISLHHTFVTGTSETLKRLWSI